MTKSEYELQVFKAFADASGIGVEPDSARSERPPLPDIACRVKGETRYFELTRVADQNIADTIAAQATGKSGPVAHSYSDQADVVDAVHRKADKEYQTDGCPLELLLYADALHPPVYLPVVEGVLGELAAEFGDKWHRIWLFDWRKKEVMWSSDRD